MRVDIKLQFGDRVVIHKGSPGSEGTNWRDFWNVPGVITGGNSREAVVQFDDGRVLRTPWRILSPLLDEDFEDAVEVCRENLLRRRNSLPRIIKEADNGG
ncbi:MAG: hypothetical protein R3251_04380 [Candidatus Spechtbacterales bacterium]|nr:hypothetical protein [Candidatus Spechtbacterales bacterium]